MYDAWVRPLGRPAVSWNPWWRLALLSGVLLAAIALILLSLSSINDPRADRVHRPDTSGAHESSVVLRGAHDAKEGGRAAADSAKDLLPLRLLVRAKDDESPVGGALVEVRAGVYGGVGEHLAGPLVTNAEGRVEIPRFGIRRATVIVRADGYAMGWGTWPPLHWKRGEWVTVVLESPVGIDGVVTDAMSGSVLAGVTVRAWEGGIGLMHTSYTSKPFWVRSKAISDEGGSFRIPDVGGWCAIFSVEAPGYAKAWKNVVSWEHVRRSRFDFALVPAGHLEGLVLGSDGAPLSGATVHASDLSIRFRQGGPGTLFHWSHLRAAWGPDHMWDGGEPLNVWAIEDLYEGRAAMTDETGRWRVDGLPLGGRFEVWATYKGLPQASIIARTVLPAVRPILLRMGSKPTPSTEAELKAPRTQTTPSSPAPEPRPETDAEPEPVVMVTVRGRVLTRDGVPVADARIKEGLFHEEILAVTGRDGRFAFSWPKKKYPHLVVSLKGREPRPFGGWEWLEQECDIVLLGSGTLRVPIRWPEPESPPDYMCIHRPGGTLGTFFKNRVEEGSVLPLTLSDKDPWVVVHFDDWVPLRFENDLEDGEIRTLEPVVLNRGLVLEFMVRDATGLPIEHAFVKVEPESFRRPQTAHTDADGRARVTGLVAGQKAAIEITASGRGTFEETRVLTARPPREIILPRPARVYGFVRDTRGYPFAEVIVSARLLDDEDKPTRKGEYTRTDNAGRFVLFVEPGRYRLRMSLPMGYPADAPKPSATIVDVARGQAMMVFIAVERPRS